MRTTAKDPVRTEVTIPVTFCVTGKVTEDELRKYVTEMLQAWWGNGEDPTYVSDDCLGGYLFIRNPT